MRFETPQRLEIISALEYCEATTLFLVACEGLVIADTRHYNVGFAHFFRTSIRKCRQQKIYARQ